jgi:hypothetical protein
MTFIERELFHDKRNNLIVYENNLVDFIGKESECDLLKGNSSG